MTNEAKRNEDTVEPLVRLSEFDRIVTAYARKASGPGWSNRPLWVVVEDRRTGKMREECIQPQQQSEEVWRLYDIASEVDAALYAAVKRMLPNPSVLLPPLGGGKEQRVVGRPSDLTKTKEIQ